MGNPSIGRSISGRWCGGCGHGQEKSLGRGGKEEKRKEERKYPKAEEGGGGEGLHDC